MDYTFTAGAALGVSLGLTPGPVVAEIIHRGTTGGLRSALSVAVGALLGNLSTAGFSIVGAGALMALPSISPVLRVAGAAWLAYLGVDSWRQAGRLASGGPASEKARPRVPGPLAGLVMVVTNPLVWTFWLAVMAAAGRVGRLAGPLFALGFMLGVTSSDVSLAVLSSRGAKRLGPRGQRAALRVCSALLIGFAAYSLVPRS